MDRRPVALVLALLAIAGMSTHLVLLGPMAIDDAYISYRYAANLERGDGFVFNEGERVQGFTNPLYTLLLAAAAVSGADIPGAATAIGCLSAVVAALVLVFFLPGACGRVAGLFAAIGLLLTPEFVLNALSGMETALFCALLMGAAWAFDRERWGIAGVLAGLLLLTRADGAIWLAVPAIRLAVRDRVALREAALPAIVIWGSWLLFAWAYYGSPWPHSIAAKRLIHRGDFLPVLLRHLDFLTATQGLKALWVLATIGLLAEARDRTSLAALGAGAVLYLLGLSATGIMPFEVPRYFLWYPVPLIPVGFLLAARAAQRAGRALERRASSTMTTTVVALAPAVFALGSYLGMWSRDLPAIRGHFQFRERGYEEIARVIRDEAGARRTDVLVGEVGVVGYHLLGHRVHDSSGINSPRILRLRAADRDSLAAEGVTPPALDEGSPRWVLRFLREARPEYVTTMRLFLYMSVLENIPAFHAIYEPVAEDRVWVGEGMIRHTLYGARGREGAGREGS